MMEVTSYATTAHILDRSLTVDDCTQQIVTKYIHKITHYPAAVMQDIEPESLHKMRVAVRRLQAVLQVLEPLVILPTAFHNKKIGQLAKVLGAVRDLDVMAELLQSVELTVPTAEIEILTTVAKPLIRLRQQAFTKMAKYLAHNYRSLIKASHQWLKHPQYFNQNIAMQPIANVLPDLLLPLIGEFCQHPGWWIATKLDRHQNILHDLRKLTKRVRYQTECFSPYLPADSRQFLQPLEASQEYLGQMQDAQILQNFMRQEIGHHIIKKLPILSDRLYQITQQAWQDWQPIRIQLCDRDWRKSWRVAVM
jgi:CHAD domain-containing protein